VAEGWVNIDRSLGNKKFPCHPEIVADVRDLPFKDATADAVYCGHLLEHLPQDQVVVALSEIRRVLKAGGRFAVVGPDFDRATERFPEMCESIWPGTFGEWSDWEGAPHQWCATASNTLELVRQVFPDAKEVPITSLDPFWPAVAFLEWQFAIEAA
jgi:SAM-dependent methyltransferase